MKQSIEEDVEGGANGRGEWPMTSMAKSSHGPIAEAFQEINEEQDQRVVRKLIFCHQSLQRKGKDISWLGFPLAHTTPKKAAVTSVSTQDIIFWDS